MNTIEDKKMDLTSRLMDVTDKFNKFIAGEFSDFTSYFNEKIETGVYALLNGEKPKVMVYGIYNSGKSTLINSLCKKEVAETADRPLTDEIAEYDRGDYYLVDSPGVDAPIQHEMVTEEHINQCHVILFVISSKGMFEDRTNYRKLVNLIKKDIPFVIVLNDRGCPIKKEWSEEEKVRVKFDHEQELKRIQYKIIDNLITESNDKNIVNKYEVVIINAKKAWTGIEKNKPQLYEKSGIEFLDTRISQILKGDAIGTVYKQPISNLKECLNEVEKMITQTMSGNLSEDFSMRLHTFERKRDNILEDLRILTQQAVEKHLDELTNFYVNGDEDMYESIANTIYMEIDERYVAKVNEMLVFVEHNFKDLNLYINNDSNLMCDLSGKKGSKLAVEEDGAKEYEDINSVPVTKHGIWEIFKTRKKREEEKREQLEREARIKNERIQYEVQEKIRRRQEARQLASSDLDVLAREFNNVVTRGLSEKYDEIISQIQQIDCMNKQMIEDGERQMRQVKAFRNGILEIENSIS